MTTNTKTFAFGTLEENGDTWMLATGGHVILLDLTISPMSLEHKTVSVIGTMGIPRSAPGILKLIVEHLVSHADIATRAFDIFKSGQGGSATENWLQAERELLAM